MSSTKSHPSDRDLASLLIAASIRSGRPLIPSGERGRVVSLLMGLMADGRRLDEYVADLSTLEGGAGAIGEQDSEAVDERDERIVEAGFTWLPDEELAALSLSPRGLKDLYELLEDPETETGEWLMDALTAAHGDSPKVLELERLARQRVARILGDERPDVIPFDPERGTRPGAYRWAGKLAPLAAGLLVGVLLGTTAFREGGGPSSFDVSVASESSRTRGAEDRPGVRIESGGEGFVAVVALAPGRRPQVVPDVGVDDVQVRRGSPAVVQLPERTTEALSVVTETPASEPLRRALREKAFEPGQLEGLKAFVKAALETKGFRRMAFETTTLAE